MPSASPSSQCGFGAKRSAGGVAPGAHERRCRARRVPSGTEPSSRFGTSASIASICASSARQRLARRPRCARRVRRSAGRSAAASAARSAALAIGAGQRVLLGLERFGRGARGRRSRVEREDAVDELGARRRAGARRCGRDRGRGAEGRYPASTPSGALRQRRRRVSHERDDAAEAPYASRRMRPSRAKRSTPTALRDAGRSRSRPTLPRRVRSRRPAVEDGRRSARRWAASSPTPVAADADYPADRALDDGRLRRPRRRRRAPAPHRRRGPHGRTRRRPRSGPARRCASRPAACCRRRRCRRAGGGRRRAAAATIVAPRRAARGAASTSRRAATTWQPATAVLPAGPADRRPGTRRCWRRSDRRRCRSTGGRAVAIVSTGDELVDAGAAPGTRPGARLQPLGGRRGAARARLRAGAASARARDEAAESAAPRSPPALAAADAVVLTGGSSVGVRDLRPGARSTAWAARASSCTACASSRASRPCWRRSAASRSSACPAIRPRADDPRSDRAPIFRALTGERRRAPRDASRPIGGGAVRRPRRLDVVRPGRAATPDGARPLAAALLAHQPARAGRRLRRGRPGARRASRPASPSRWSATERVG